METTQVECMRLKVMFYNCHTRVCLVPCVSVFYYSNITMVVIHPSLGINYA